METRDALGEGVPVVGGAKTLRCFWSTAVELSCTTTQ